MDWGALWQAALLLLVGFVITQVTTALNNRRSDKVRTDEVESAAKAAAAAAEASVIADRRVLGVEHAGMLIQLLDELNDSFTAQQMESPRRFEGFDVDKDLFPRIIREIRLVPDERVREVLTAGSDALVSMPVMEQMGALDTTAKFAQRSMVKDLIDVAAGYVNNEALSADTRDRVLPWTERIQKFYDDSFHDEGQSNV